MLQDQITATPERIAKAGEKYVGPKKSQTEDRLAGKVLSSLELMQRRGALKPHQFEAGASLYFYWAGANRITGITGSYGDQRWSGTKDSQADTQTMIRPEWRTYCHQRLQDA
nr:hypothetical protein [Alphaproteobacteria bacterium]